jgi:hypothetical protein
MTTKKAAKKKPVIPDGITLYRNSKGICARIAENGRILADLGGYNNRANATKGLLALYNALGDAWVMGEAGKFLTVEHPSMKPKKAAPKKK